LHSKNFCILIYIINFFNFYINFIIIFSVFVKFSYFNKKKQKKAKNAIFWTKHIRENPLFGDFYIFSFSVNSTSLTFFSTLFFKIALIAKKGALTITKKRHLFNYFNVHNSLKKVYKNSVKKYVLGLKKKKKEPKVTLFQKI
jgi:hypothetical protein